MPSVTKIALSRRLNIFWRIMSGYFLVILLLMVISAASLMNLNRMTRVINDLIYSDLQAVELGKQMIDSFLSRVRNIQKYLVTGDPAFFNLSQAGKTRFLEYHQQLGPKLSSAEEEELAGAILASFRDYDALLEKETDAFGRGQPPPADTSAKENKADDVTRALDRLVSTRQKSTIARIEGLRAIGTRAAVMVQILFAVGVVSAVLVAFLVTKGIHRPLQRIKRMTTVVAAGDFEQRIDIHSPPELAELSQAFNHMSNELKQLDEMKSGFISHVSHELRTPLASIKEADHLLLEETGGPLTDPQRRLLTMIGQSTKRLTKMIDDLLDLSKMEAGMMRYNFAPADIRPILAHGLAGIELLAGKKSLKLESDVMASPPLVRMDMFKIQQVVDNLLSNALKYCREGARIRVKADLVRSPSESAKGPQEGRYLRVSISDTGIGIPPEYQARIFDRFLEIQREEMPGTKGTGLGLSIARHIVKDHGGRIWVNSVPGRGSTFSFVLPLEGKDAAADARRS
jgi:two-component system, NtrC family, sensor histidine kinase GlrK